MQRLQSNALPDNPGHKAQALAIHAGAPVSRDRFHNDVASLCARLAQHPEIRWGLYCDESYIFAVSLIALLCSDKIPVILPNLQPDFIRGISSHLDGLLSDRAQALPRIVSLQASVGAAFAGAPAISLEKIEGTISIFTSGSTGEPKKIDKRWQQLRSEIEVLEQTWGRQLDGSHIVSTVSHQHIYGLLFKVLWPMLGGRCFDSDTYQYPEPLLERIGSLPAVALISSPAHLKRIPKMVDLAKARGRLVAVFSSGGPLPNDAAVGIARILGLQVNEVFGSTETGGVAYRSQLEPGETAPWTPLPLVDVRSDPEDGCLLIRSPFEGSGSWYKMGDIVELLDDNRFITQGRADKILKVEEKRLSLAEVETRLAGSALVAEAAATVLDGHRHSVAVVAVLSREGRAFLEHHGHRQLCSQLREHLARYFEAVVLPKKWRFIEQMPVNSQGKLTQAALRQLFLKTEPIVDEKFTLLPLVESVRRTDTRVILDLRIPADVLYFNGHFPDRPVLPGVAQVAWAHAFGNQHFDMPGDFRGMEALKFHRFIEPGDSIRLTLSYNPDKRKLVFNYESDKGVHSSGRLLMG